LVRAVPDPVPAAAGPEEPAPARLSEPTNSADRDQEESLTTNEKLLLTDVHRHLGSPVTERYERAGLKTYQGNKAKAALLRKGFAMENDISTDATGRVKLLVFTKTEQKALDALGTNPNRSHRRGGPDHEYWKRKIAAKYRSKG
jgi:hypothetical protein